MAFSGVLFCGDTSESAKKSLVRPLSRKQAAGFLFHRRLQNRGGANPSPTFGLRLSGGLSPAPEKPVPPPSLLVGNCLEFAKPKRRELNAGFGDYERL